MMHPELRKVGFHRLWAGETVSVFGSHFTIFAVPLIAVTLLEATPLEMGMLNAANSAAVLVFGLSAGVLADRYRKRPVMVAGNLLRAMALLIGPVLYFAGLLNIWALMGVMFVVGVGGILTDSAYSAFVYELVPRKHLNSANAWTQGSSSASDAGGPALAGVLVQWLSGPIVLIIDALSYVVTSLFLMTLPPGRAPEPRTESRSHWSEVRAGLVSLWRQRVLRLSTVAAAHSNLFHSMFFAVFMIFVVRHLGIAEGFIGLVMSIGGFLGF